MAWRLARSLVVLRDEIRTLHPGTTVWTIGDAAHRATASDHNPNQADVVCATDTLGNAGLDLGWYAERVRQAGIGGHPAPKYVIYNRRIASRSRGWTWRPYHGSNPHTGHVHVSAGIGPDGRSTGPYDDTSPWGLLSEEDDMELTDRVDMTNPAGGRWSFGEILGKDAITVKAALGYAAAGGWQLQHSVVPQVKAILAAVAGDDVVAAVQVAIRQEFAALGPALAEQLGDVPAERVEAALRAVLGSLDDAEPA